MSDDPHPAPADDFDRRLEQALPRYAAPPEVRAAIIRMAAGRRPARWVAPVLAAAATAAVLLLAGWPLLVPAGPPDPAGSLVRAAVAEHTRTALWGTRRAGRGGTDLAWLRAESGIGLEQVFLGDEVLRFEGAEPVYLEGRRGVALHYRDPEAGLVSYVILPAPGLSLPERQRVRVDRWRPALYREGAFAVWAWPQGRLGCFVVAPVESRRALERFRQAFVRIRAATEPIYTW